MTTLQKMLLKKRINMINKEEHCGFKLMDIDYNNRSVILRKNDESEEVRFSFEYIQDIARYTTGEWKYEKIK